MPDFAPVAARLGLGRLLESSSVSGGSIHSAWKLEFEQGPVFLKLNSSDKLPLLQAEQTGLAALAAALADNGTLRTPRALACDAAPGYAWLALEWLDLRPLDDAGGERLGRQLAELHHHTAVDHGLDHANFIGTTPQDNTPHADWPWFFGHRRLAPLLQALREKGLFDRVMVGKGERLVEGLPGFFVGLALAPSLLHGDLWSGNAAMLADGTPVIFDPAPYYGHREADLAMMELFGGFPGRCYAAYRLAWPLAPGYEQRKTLYNLYHVLNHYLMFGASYGNQARRMIESLVAELRS